VAERSRCVPARVPTSLRGAVLLVDDILTAGAGRLRQACCEREPARSMCSPLPAPEARVRGLDRGETVGLEVDQSQEEI
jgi:hypothetical protein